jgi:hypothetical protein
MPGGLMQLTQVGAQNQLINGNPSMTHFRAVYRRYTNFAMESIRMDFSSSKLDFNATQTRTLSCRIDRFAQLLHDTYLMVTLPDIWSPMAAVSTPPSSYEPNCTAIGYEFQWIKNIGYNLIDHVDIVMNNVTIQTLTGEWLKMYSYFTHDAAKRRVVDQMVGNVPELYDPANAYDRMSQYPHAVTPASLPTTMPFTLTPEPSIRSRQLVIPLHFWFCENPGLVLPLVSLQNSEVYINVTLRPLNQLYTVIDVNPAIAAATISTVVSTGLSVSVTTTAAHGFSVGTSVTLQGLLGSAIPLNTTFTITSVPTVTTFTIASTVTIAGLDQTQTNASVSGSTNPSYGQRIQPTGSYPIGLFLSPPSASGASTTSTVTTFYANPYLEGNFIYLTDMEMNQLATADQTCLIKQIRHVVKEGQYGANSDLEIPMFNMVTRIVFAAHRSDKLITNDWDNYTNWTNPNRAPFSGSTTAVGDLLYSSGQYQISSVYPREVITDGILLLDGNQRFATKPTQYFSLLQQYKHTTGEQPSTLPGIYMYSFGLNNDQYQPSGALNASMFNKAVLRVSLQQPLPTAVGSGAQSIVCILKSTALSQNPVVISDPLARNPPTAANPEGSLIYPPDQLLSVVQTVANNNIIFSYTYSVGVYVESINYLRIVSGLANLVFAN